MIIFHFSFKPKLLQIDAKYLNKQNKLASYLEVNYKNNNPKVTLSSNWIKINVTKLYRTDDMRREKTDFYNHEMEVKLFANLG